MKLFLILILYVSVFMHHVSYGSAVKGRGKGGAKQDLSTGTGKHQIDQKPIVANGTGTIVSSENKVPKESKSSSSNSDLPNQQNKVDATTKSSVAGGKPGSKNGKAGMKHVKFGKKLSKFGDRHGKASGKHGKSDATDGNAGKANGTSINKQFKPNTTHGKARRMHGKGGNNIGKVVRKHFRKVNKQGKPGVQQGKDAKRNNA